MLFFRSCFSRQKLQIWKQFTTLLTSGRPCCFLFFAPKITNLKAIHNYFWSKAKFFAPVFRAKNYKFESNSQLPRKQVDWEIPCFSRQKLQIWKQFTTIVYCLSLIVVLFFAPKITNLKAIHNRIVVNYSTEQPVFRAKNYKFESNSQRLRNYSLARGSCFSRQKLQIWKQFTTSLRKI